MIPILKNISLLLTALAVAYLLPAYANELNSDREVKKVTAVATWIERFYDSNAIKIVSRNGLTEWGLVEIPHVSKHRLASATTLTLDSGQRLLFWSEFDVSTGDQRILYKTQTGLDSDWSKPSVLYDEGAENIGISVLRRDAEIWVFWASTSTDLPDIYYKVLSNGRWSREALAHPPNDVPDFKPIAELSNSGEVTLRWLSFDEQTGNYATQEKILSGTWENEPHTDKINPAEINLPPFIPNGRSISIRFPENIFVQSINLDRP